MPELVDYINVVNICTYLLAEELLTFDERTEILELKGKHLQVPHLFKILTTKGRDWYNRFWRALKNSISWNDVHLGHKDFAGDVAPREMKTCLRLKQDGGQEIRDIEIIKSGTSCFRVQPKR